MRELTIISGKGGTGKTTLAVAFISIEGDVVTADCDVDASNLHLILEPEVLETHEFTGLKIALRDEEACTECGKCLENCRFGAIDDSYNIMESRCEGCGVCEFVCPADAITLGERVSGHAYLSRTRFGPMAHARLKAAEEASGKLVSVVRENARELQQESGNDLIIIDGPPGIGCPVIASISGVSLVLIVTEPTVTGKLDLERIHGVATHFGIPAVVCINKCDINEENARAIEGFCGENGIRVVGRLPYDNVTTEAMTYGKSVIEYSDGAFSDEVRRVWGAVKEELR